MNTLLFTFLPRLPPSLYPLSTSTSSFPFSSPIPRSDGYCVSIGNVLSVQFYGEERQFTVKEVEPVAVEPNLSLSLNTSRSLSSLLEDCVQLNMSGLTLGEGGGGDGGGGGGGQGEGEVVHTPVRTASDLTAALTSTPRMDVDSAPVHSSMDFGQVWSPHSELNQDSRPTELLEGQMRRLGLGEDKGEAGQEGREEGGGTEGSGGEEAVVEVTVCKINSKTEVVFTEEQRSKNVSHYGPGLFCVLQRPSTAAPHSLSQ